MKDNDIPVKTAAGTDEVSRRARKLPQRLRTMLIMVDGEISAAQLRQAAVTLGAPADCLESLEAQGLIQAQAAAAAPAPLRAAEPAAAASLGSDPERFRAAQKFMNDSAVDALGLRAFFFTLKLEKCYTCDDLRALLPDFTRLIAKGSGDPAARLLAGRARDILN
jgi:hypothetical protein